MPLYVEFPADQIVNVHWKKKDDGPPPDVPNPCGMFYAPEAAPLVGISRWSQFPYVAFMLQITDPMLALYPPPPDGSGYPTHNYCMSVLAIGPEYDLYYIGGDEGSVKVTIEVIGPNNAPPFDTAYPYDLQYASPRGLIQPYAQIGIDVYYHTSWQNITVSTPADETATGATRAEIIVDFEKARAGPPTFAVWGGEPRFTTNQTAHGFGRFNHYFSRGVSLKMQFNCTYQTVGAPPPQPGINGGNGWNPGHYPPSPGIPGPPQITQPPGVSTARRRGR